VEGVDLARLRGDDHQLAQTEPVLGERFVVLALVVLSSVLAEDTGQRLRIRRRERVSTLRTTSINTWIT
jgi:hypothetical protein